VFQISTASRRQAARSTSPLMASGLLTGIGQSGQWGTRPSNRGMIMVRVKDTRSA